jgi:hypothetical protein
LALCRATGSLNVNARVEPRGEWEIEMSAQARVVVEDDHIMLLHCTRCNGPFAR